MLNTATAAHRSLLLRAHVLQVPVALAGGDKRLQVAVHGVVAHPLQHIALSILCMPCKAPLFSTIKMNRKEKQICQGTCRVSNSPG